MATLADATLSEVERRVVRRFVRALEDDLGGRLRSIWLYGSRARGEQAHDESDVDLLVVADDAGWEARRRMARILYTAAEAEGGRPAYFSLHVYTPERLAQRREIESFFIQEVDRDKIVLSGEP